jgi:hypothetical protein
MMNDQLSCFLKRDKASFLSFSLHAKRTRLKDQSLDYFAEKDYVVLLLFVFHLVTFLFTLHTS